MMLTISNYDAWKLQSPPEEEVCECRKCECEYGEECAYECQCQCCTDPEQDALDYADYLNDSHRDDPEIWEYDGSDDTEGEW